MRLLRTTTLTDDKHELVVEEFSDPDIPQYAMLSHAWEEDEVTFAHVENNTATTRKGYQKIKYVMDQARKDNLDYVWVDTCCIDKTSSAELSEAINSMFTWYSASVRCYAYLADVDGTADSETQRSEFSRSRWFTRGWTLQELLAPPAVIFFSKEWIGICERNSHSHIISDITNIDVDILDGTRPFETVSIAKRMSWAAARKTKRPEDIAYCLMGLFSVNMPMLYGEGGVKAFHRLQEEIMKHSDDSSLFAWGDYRIPEQAAHGLLADRPAAFAKSGNVVQLGSQEEEKPFEMTNRGLRVGLNLYPTSEDSFIATFDCISTSEDYDGLLGMHLKKIKARDHEYTRIKCDRLVASRMRGEHATIYVRQHIRASNPDDIRAFNFLYMRQLNLLSDRALRLKVIDVLPQTPYQRGEDAELKLPAGNFWEHCPSFRDTFKLSKSARQLSTVMLLRDREGRTFALMLGSLSPLTVGFDFRDYEFAETEHLSFFQEHYQPQPAGSFITVANIRVNVEAYRRVTSLSMVYMININIQMTTADVANQNSLRNMIQARARNLMR